MPELPEAETIVRDLRKRVPGHTVLRARIIREDLLAKGLTARQFNTKLKGRRIEDVVRRGKNVVFVFSGDVRLVINLGMTGRVLTSDVPRAAEMRHIGAELDLDDGRRVIYDDARRFGNLDVRNAVEWAQRDAELGTEPLSAEHTAEHLYELTRSSITPIRNWLLDQRKLAGVGNIYAVEALFRAGVRPTRRAKTLTKREASLLRDSLRDVLQESIDKRGTTISDYRDADGESGENASNLRAYGREDRACLTCGTKIKRVVMSNRSAFYCPKCQK